MTKPITLQRGLFQVGDEFIPEFDISWNIGTICSCFSSLEFMGKGAGIGGFLERADAASQPLPEARRESVLEVSQASFRAQCDACTARIRGVGFQACEAPDEGGRLVSCDLWAKLREIPHARLREQYPELLGVQAHCLPAQEMCLQIPNEFSTLRITREGRAFSKLERSNVSYFVGEPRLVGGGDTFTIASADFFRATASTPNETIEAILCRWLESGITIRFE